jgi:hypothetical protein
MVVDQINVGHVAVLELKNNPPIGAEGDTPEAGEISLEWVQPETGEIQVFGLRSTAQKRQHPSDLLNVLSV